MKRFAPWIAGGLFGVIVAVAVPLVAQHAPMRRLANGKVLMGNASDIGRPVTPSGDCTLTNAGVVTCTDITVGSDATGDVLYKASATAFGRLGIGNEGEALRSNTAGTAPAWVGIGNREVEQPKNVYILGSQITPSCSTATGGASVGADTTITFCNLGYNLPGMAIYYTTESAGREGPEPVVDANSCDGFYVPGTKKVNNTGATVTFGGDMKNLLATPTGPTQFIVGTDAAFYMEVTMGIPDVSDYDVMFIGFVEAEAAYVAAIAAEADMQTAYAEKYGFSLADNAGDIDTNTSKNNADVNTDLTVDDWSDDEVKTWRVNIGAAGVVTYVHKDAGVTDTSDGTAAITVTDTTVLTPILIYTRSAGAAADTPPIIESIEWGYQ